MVISTGVWVVTMIVTCCLGCHGNSDTCLGCRCDFDTCLGCHGGSGACCLVCHRDSRHVFRLS
jgi:hypothetical protein